MLQKLLNYLLCLFGLHKWMYTEDDLRRTCEFCDASQDWIDSNKRFDSI